MGRRHGALLRGAGPSLPGSSAGGRGLQVQPGAADQKVRETALWDTAPQHIRRTGGWGRWGVCVSAPAQGGARRHPGLGSASRTPRAEGHDGLSCWQCRSAAPRAGFLEGLLPGSRGSCRARLRSPETGLPRVSLQRTAFPARNCCYVWTILLNANEASF